MVVGGKMLIHFTIGNALQISSINGIDVLSAPDHEASYGLPNILWPGLTSHAFNDVDHRTILATKVLSDLVGFLGRTANKLAHIL